MRINAFVSFDPLFSEINTVLEHPSIADIIEDKNGELFEFPYQNINVISGRTYRTSIESGGLSTLVSNMFSTSVGKAPVIILDLYVLPEITLIFW